jgi:DNA-binding NarL/FixJ family response regulator
LQSTIVLTGELSHIATLQLMQRTKLFLHTSSYEGFGVEEFDKLAPREQEVLSLLVTGHSYKMIADKCGITIETVRSHIKRIYEKLQVHSATEAATKAFPGRRR